MTELAKKRPDLRRRKEPHTLHILDEPAVGPHMADVERHIRLPAPPMDAGRHSATLWRP